MAVNTVIFDIGRVLIRWEWDEYIHSLFDDVTAQAVTEATFGNSLWKEMDRGIMSTEEIHAGMVAVRPEYAAEIREALDRVNECSIRLDYAIPWIESVKARGCRVLYLSNYSDFVRGKSTAAMDFLSHMDGGVFSYEELCIKPDRKIYNILIDRYSLEPADCVFIDDTVDNIRAARELGFNGIVFENYEQSRAELDKLLSE